MLGVLLAFLCTASNKGSQTADHLPECACAKCLAPRRCFVKQIIESSTRRETVESGQAG